MDAVQISNLTEQEISAVVLSVKGSSSRVRPSASLVKFRAASHVQSIRLSVRRVAVIHTSNGLTPPPARVQPLDISQMTHLFPRVVTRATAHVRPAKALFQAIASAVSPQRYFHQAR